MTNRYTFTSHAIQRAAERSSMSPDAIIDAMTSRGVVTYAGAICANYRGMIFFDLGLRKALVCVISKDNAVVTILPAQRDSGDQLALCERRTDGTVQWYGTVKRSEIRMAVQLAGMDPDVYYPKPPKPTATPTIDISARFQDRTGKLSWKHRKIPADSPEEAIADAMNDLAKNIVESVNPLGLAVYAKAPKSQAIIREWLVRDFVSANWLP